MESPTTVRGDLTLKNNHGLPQGPMFTNSSSSFFLSQTIFFCLLAIYTSGDSGGWGQDPALSFSACPDLAAYPPPKV